MFPNKACYCVSPVQKRRIFVMAADILDCERICAFFLGCVSHAILVLLTCVMHVKMCNKGDQLGSTVYIIFDIHMFVLWPWLEISSESKNKSIDQQLKYDILRSGYLFICARHLSYPK